MMIRHFDGTRGCPQNLGNLLVVHILEISHDKDKSLFLRESAHDSQKPFLSLIAVEIRIRLKTGDIRSLGRGKGQQMFQSCLSESVKSLIGYNPVYLGIKTRLPSEKRKRVPYLQKDLLQQVIGIFM